MTDRKRERTKSGTAASGLTHDAIVERARAIFVAQGSQPGRDVENWLQAESELLAELSQGKVRRARR